MLRLRAWMGFAALVVASACGGPPASEAGKDALSGARAPLFEGLGSHARAVSTRSAEAQRYFDQGLNLLFAFNHDEALRSFAESSRLDPACAMAYWGMAIAHGPHINNPAVPVERERAAWEAAVKARELSSAASAPERALIAAAVARYADPPRADRAPLDLAYAQAMEAAAGAFPEDADIQSLYAEALMDLHPWDLWEHDGRPKPWTGAIVAALEAVLARTPRHPLANHLYIHAVEASPNPERADLAADRLRAAHPGLGHLTHMPSHIDVRRGRWPEAVAANEKALAADRRYLEAAAPKLGFYRIYMAHNHHMLAYAALMEGRSELALRTIDAMVAEIPAEWLRENAFFADGFMAMPLEVRMRFGKWDEILAAPEPAEYLPISRTLRHYARGVAFAAQGKTREAGEAQAAFLRAREAIREGAIFGNNAAADLVKVAEHLLAGELLVRAGRLEAGLAELRTAVEREDQLRYDEPPDWIQPVRHALGATLLTAGRAAQAEQVYREDLRRIPDNGWSLFGLGRSLRLQQQDKAAAEWEARFEKIWSGADVKLASSCFCQPGV